MAIFSLRASKLKLSLLAVLALGLMVVFPAHKALAIFSPEPGVFTTDSPPDGSGRFDPGCTAANSGCYSQGTQVRPYYVVGNNSQDYTYSVMTLAVYVLKSSGSITIKVNNAAPDCYSAPSGGTGLTGPDYHNTASSPPTQYVLYGASGTLDAKTVAGGGCGVITTFTTDASQAYNMATPSNNFNGYFQVVADVLNSPQEGENSFWVTETSGSDASGYIGGAGVAGLGYRDGNLANGNYWNSFTYFSAAINCNDLGNDNSSVNGTISYQDSDVARTDWNTNMIYELQRQQVNGDGTTGGWQFVARNTQGVNMSQSATLYSGPIYKNYRYRLILANVGVRNTIRVSLSGGLEGVFADLSERPTTAQCKTTGGGGMDATCTVNGNANLTLNNSATVTWQFNNTGKTPWTTSDNPLTQYRRTVDGTQFNPITIPKNVPVGGNFQIQLTETAPATGTKTIKYTMWQSGQGAFGSVCTLKINASKCTVNCSPPGSGSISVTCNSITISGVNVPGTTTFGGASRKITRVPTAIVMTAPSGATYTWLVNDGKGNYGIPNQATGGSGGNTTFSIDPFKIPGINFTMYPHLSYTVQLALEGANSPVQNSTTYQDNGWWNPTNNANDGGYYYGITFADSEFTPTDCLSASCGGTTPADVEPGQSANLSAGIVFTNKTSTSWPTAGPNEYQMVLSTSPGLKITSGPTYGTIVPGSGATFVNFTAEIDSSGSYSVSLLFNGSPLDLGQQNPCPTQNVTAATRPYFDVQGADVSSGGGFYDAGGNCSAANYVSPASSGYPGNSAYAGGIRAYGNRTPVTGIGFAGGGIGNYEGRGSRAELGVVSLGLDVGNISGGSYTGPTGIYTRNYDIANNNDNDASRLFTGGITGAVTPNFAYVGGDNGDNVGGLLNSTQTSTAHCAYDYYDKTQKGGADEVAAPVNSGILDIGAIGSQPSKQYSYTGNLILSGSGACQTIKPGVQATVYVDGDVTIGNNICLQDVPAGSIDRTKVPYFALVVRGNISIASNVTRIDGFYVAQPQVNSTTDGVFNTCDQGAPTNGFCPRQLLVQGAVIAEQVKLMREHGTMSQLNSDPNGICTEYSSDQNLTPGSRYYLTWAETGGPAFCGAAEIFRYEPYMAIGSPNFAPVNPSDNGTLSTSLYSLPPVF